MRLSKKMYRDYITHESINVLVDEYNKICNAVSLKNGEYYKDHKNIVKEFSGRLFYSNMGTYIVSNDAVLILVRDTDLIDEISKLPRKDRIDAIELTSL